MVFPKIFYFTVSVYLIIRGFNKLNLTSTYALNTLKSKGLSTRLNKVNIRSFKCLTKVTFLCALMAANDYLKLKDSIEKS